MFPPQRVSSQVQNTTSHSIQLSLLRLDSVSPYVQTAQVRSREQSGSITRSNCIKHCPSTSSAPTTTTWAPNRAFGLPPGIPQGYCDQPCTSQSSASAHQCSAGWCASHTPPAPYSRVGISTVDVAPAKVHVLCHPTRRANMKSLKPCQSGRAQDPRLASVQEDRLYDRLVKLSADSWGCILLAQHLSNPSPRPTCLAKLASHGLYIFIILQEQAFEVP